MLCTLFSFTHILQFLDMTSTVTMSVNQSPDGERKKREETLSASREMIEIEGEWYALDEIPPDNSAVVTAEIDIMLGVFDLGTFATDLGQISKSFKNELEAAEYTEVFPVYTRRQNAVCLIPCI